MGWQAWSAADHLRQAKEQLPLLRQQVSDGDTDRAAVTLERMSTDAATARERLQAPWWGAATHLPLVGRDLDVVRQLTRDLDRVTNDVGPRLLTAAQSVDAESWAVQGGRVDLDPIAEVEDDLTTSADALGEVSDRGDALLDEPMADALRPRVADFYQAVDELTDRVTLAAKVARLLPPMLGRDGPRTYLVLAQNTAEQRSLGGIAGAAVLVRADDGRLRLGRQASANDIGEFRRPVLPLTDVETTLFDRVVGQYPQNVTSIPHFPRSAQLGAAMWQRRFGGDLDGVLAVDPYALQLLLAVTGPVRVGPYELTGDNAASILLHQVYLDIADPAAQDVLFARATRAVFDRLREDTPDPQSLGRALSTAVEQGRLLLWSDQPDEQRLLSGSRIAGELTGQVGGDPAVGVFFHDRTQSKMSWFQRVDVRVEPTGCDGGMTTAGVTVTIRSAAPADAASLPDYVTGAGVRVPPGEILGQVVLYAPPDAAISGFRSSDGFDQLVSRKHEGLWAGAREFRLSPGESVTLTYELTFERPVERVAVRATPPPLPPFFGIRLLDCGDSG